MVAYRRSLAAILGVALVTSMLAITGPLAAAQPPTAEPTVDVVVQLKPGSNPDAEAQQAQSSGGRTKHVFRNVIRGFAASLPERAVENLRRNPRVALVEPDILATATVTQTPVVWGLDRIDQRALPVNNQFTYPAAGAGVTAYVFDTGINAGHTDFAGRTRAGFTAISDGRGTTDCNGHGTHVAGTIAGTTYGVAKAASLVPVRVLGCTGSGSISGIIAGLDWAATDHAAGTPAVANMSLTSATSTTFDTAVQGLIDDGVSVSVAGGNDNGASACTKSPSRVAAALTIGATGQNDARASFSNIGNCLDLFAPGVGILSDWYTSNTATATLNGTSMATPHVAGAAAVLLSQQPASSPAQIATQIRDSATTGVVTNAGTDSPNRLLFVQNPVGAPIVVTDPGPQAGTVNAPAGLQLTASGGTGPYTWSATGLPAGLTINASGLISGTPTTAAPYTVTVTATDTTSATASRTFSWTINPAAQACASPGQKLGNPGFESGRTTWSASSGVIGQHGALQPARAGTWSAWLGGEGDNDTENLSQRVQIPAGCTSYTLSFWLHVDTAETSTSTQDRLTVTLGSTTVATYSNLDRVTGYVEKRLDVKAFAGQTLTLRFRAVENGSLQTSFVVDDTALTVS